MLGATVQFVQLSAHAEAQVADPPGRRILIVDDDQLLRDSLKRHLARHFAVATAADGREALTWLAHQEFDAVVSDVDMPVMDGLALRTEVMTRYPALGQRFLLMSGCVPHWRRIDPTIHFIAKPFTIDELRQAIEEMLG